MPKYFRCKFCKWKTPRYRTDKKGRRRNNYHRLQMHCMIEHDEEMKKLKLLHHEKEVE